MAFRDRFQSRTLDAAWSQAIVLSLTETVSWGILYYAFVALLVPMRNDLGWSEATLTLAYSIGILVSGLAAPLVGLWLDNHSPRNLMITGSLLASILVFAWSRVDNQFIYILIWIGLGLAMSMTLYEPAFVTVTRWFAQDRAKPLLAITIFAGFASTIFLPLTTALESGYGWRSTVQILAILILVLAFLPHLLFLRNPPPRPAPKPTTSASPNAHDGLPLRSALRNSNFWRMTTGFGLQSFASTAVAAFMIAYLLERGDGAGFAAAAAGGIGAAQVVARIFTTIFGRRYSQIVLAAMMLALQTLAVLVLLLWQDKIGVAIAVLLLGAGRGALTLIRPILLADTFGLRYFASISGAQSSILSACGAIAPVSVGIAYGILASYEPIMWTMAALSLTSAIALFSARAPSPSISS
ncbi:MAG: MFS transporter [Thermomicrobiales bacterium]